MPVLLHSLVMVSKGSFGHEIDVVNVCETIVVEIVARTGNQCSDGILVA